MKNISKEDWKGVWAVAECHEGRLIPVSLELISKARELADKLQTEAVAVVLGHGIDGAVCDAFMEHGAHVVQLVEHEALAVFRDDVFAQVLAGLIRSQRPEIVLAPATLAGKAYMPRVQTMLETGLTAGCLELDIRQDDRVLIQTRAAWGGNLFVNIVCPDARPQLVTVSPNVMSARRILTEGRVECPEIPFDWLKSGMEILESVYEKQDESVRLTKAEVVVVAGRGIEKKENLVLLQELAGLLGGAVGATRAVTDLGWLPEYTQIGQTGVTVSPRLCITFGVSGAVQHTVGLRNIEILVAVNKDSEAPIFEMATYGIVADVNEFLPAFLEQIRKKRRNSAE
ncbi:MAG: electron transfer flavoprotein subunit alpha/FixB family protein [Dissulfuribacterales bacterium]